jgi:hypothetical protein
MYGRLQYDYEQIKAFRDQRIAYGDQLRSLVELVLGGKKTPDILLEAQRFYADALAGEYNAIRDYNNSIVAFEWAKGTIMQHDNVSISEGCLPTCAFKRAVAHQEERTKACVLRERANPVECASLAPEAGLPPVAKVPNDEAPALPALIKANEQLPPMSDHLSVFNNHDKEHPMKPIDVSKMPDVSGSKTQPPAPGAVIPAVKKSADFGILRPADGLPPATKPVDAPKAPAALPPVPVPVDPWAMKID